MEKQVSQSVNGKHEISLTERMLNTIYTYCSENKVSLISTVVVGLMTYMFAFTNKLVNWDDISYLFGKGATIDSGRWALPLLSYIFPDFSMPLIYGIISIAIMAVAITILIKELRIENRILQILFSGLVIAFPTMIGTVAYMFTLTSYAIAFLMSVAAVRYANGGWKQKVVAVGLSVFSMGIYQPYISVTSSFFLVSLALGLLVDNAEINQVVRKGLYFLLHLAITCLLYLIINRAVQQITGISYNEYAQDRISFAGLISLQRIKRTYTVFITELLYGEYSFMSAPIARVMHVVCAAVAGVNILFWMRTVGNWRKIALLTFIILLLPISISCMILVVDDIGVHTMLFYSFIAVYGLVCVSLSMAFAHPYRARLRGFFFDVVVMALTIILVCNVYVGNRAYLQTYVSNLNAYAFFTSLATRIEMQSCFLDDAKVALIGNADQFIYDMSEFEGASSPQVKGTTGFEVNRWSREDFIKYYVGRDYVYATAIEVSKIIDSTEFSEMPVYPYEGSIQKIGDIIVVKFSDPRIENDEP